MAVQKILEKDVQAFPIDPDKMGSTSGADTIDTSDMSLIKFDTAVTTYYNGNSLDTFDWLAGEAMIVTAVTSIHVDKAVNYMWVGTATR